MFDFRNYSTKSYDDLSKVVADKMKDVTTGAGLEDLFELKPKLYSFLVDDDSEHRKQRMRIKCCCNNKLYWIKCILLNNKCLRHSVNRIQNKTHGIGIYKIKNISASCFDDKTYIRNDRYAEWALNNYSENLFYQAIKVLF